MSTLNDTTDAMVWAQEFCRIFDGCGIIDAPGFQSPIDDGPTEVDPALMITWFANAIETGRNAGRKETCPHDDMFDIAGEMRACRTCGTLNPGG